MGVRGPVTWSPACQLRVAVSAGTPAITTEDMPLPAKPRPPTHQGRRCCKVTDLPCPPTDGIPPQTGPQPFWKMISSWRLQVRDRGRAPCVIPGPEGHSFFTTVVKKPSTLNSHVSKYGGSVLSFKRDTGLTLTRSPDPSGTLRGRPRLHLRKNHGAPFRVPTDPAAT